LCEGGKDVTQDAAAALDQGFESIIWENRGCDAMTNNLA
jgi:hypothetical protein